MVTTSTQYKPIMDALLTLLKTNCGTAFQTYSRRLVMWEQLAQSLQNGGSQIRQPALYLFDGMIVPESGMINYDRTQRSVPNKREIQRAIVIYAQIPGGGTPAGIDQTTAGGDVLYPLIEAVENAIEPTPNEYGAQTLGGLVYHCWLQGKAYTFSGDIDPQGQCMAILPVKMLIP
jgi:hypothetical protein